MHNETIIPEQPDTGQEHDAPTEASLRAEGYDDDAIQALRECGVLREDSKGEPWRPTTLDDVDYVGHRLRQLADEVEALQAQAAKRVARLEAAAKFLRARYEADCREIVAAHLPRSKAGKITRKTLDLDRVTVALRTVPGGPQITDEDALLDHIVDLFHDTDQLAPHPLVNAISVTVKREGVAAIYEMLDTDGLKATISRTAVKAHLKTLPPVADETTGEARPATLPGVTYAPAREEISFQ